MSRDSLSEEDARLRISSQISIETKKSLATHPLCFIDNNGHGDALMSQTIKLKAYLDKSWRPEVFRLCFVSIALCLAVTIWKYFV